MKTNGKVLFLGALTIAVCPGVLGMHENNDKEAVWIKHARRLQASEFLELCSQVFMTTDHMQQHSYLMSDFADEVTSLCLQIAPSPDQGTCQKDGFSDLDSSLQKAFFRHASLHMGNKKMPINLMMEWGDAGYIVSDKTSIEQEVMRNDLCVELHESIGDEFIKQIPVHEEIPEPVPEPVPEPIPVPENNDNSDNNNFPIVEVEKEEDEILSVSAIIAISCAVAAAIALFFYYEARRRNRARINRMSRFNDEDGVIQVHSPSGGRKVKPFGSSKSTPVEEIKAAINEADWDSVYKLASQIAENDDGMTPPGVGAFKGQDRSHLDAEDQERAKTLDDLAANGDWTGLAVTAALYAGETSGSSCSESGSFAYDTDDSSLERNAIRNSQNKDVEQGPSSMEQMVSSLSKALNAGNWTQVTKYANLIKDEKNSGNSFDADSQILLSSPSSSSSIKSTDSSKTEMSKKQTIVKLMRAGKWKGVSIMANMYEMESKQGHPSSSVRPYPPSPNHPYSDNRSIIRTKELRHSDRVQENIVGFRRDP